MARVAVIDDYQEYADMVAAPLRLAGHEVLTAVTETGPLDLERLFHFGPRVILIGLYRQVAAFNRPITDPAQDVLGFDPLTQLEQHPAVGTLPMILLGTGLEEVDIPTTIPYDLFLVLPRDIKLLLDKVDALAHKVKSRRKISGFLCPWPDCNSRLVFLDRPDSLFCPKCGASVTFVEGRECHFMGPDGHFYPCEIEQLRARAPREGKKNPRDALGDGSGSGGT